VAKYHKQYFSYSHLVNTSDKKVQNNPKQTAV